MAAGSVQAVVGGTVGCVGTGGVQQTIVPAKMAGLRAMVIAQLVGCRWSAGSIGCLSGCVAASMVQQTTMAAPGRACRQFVTRQGCVAGGGADDYGSSMTCLQTRPGQHPTCWHAACGNKSQQLVLLR